jgi:hypothetical protein
MKKLYNQSLAKIEEKRQKIQAKIFSKFSLSYKNKEAGSAEQVCNPSYLAGVNRKVMV